MPAGETPSAIGAAIGAAPVPPSDPPAAWASDVVLADGATVHVRPIRPDDGDRLRAFHAALSDRSVYYRFFSPKPRLSDREVERFTHIDYHDRVALVAVLGDDLVAVARYDRWPGKDEAEVAFVVADAHQGRGISTLLLEHLAAIARTKGITHFTAEVLPDNRAMLSVFRRAGFEVRNAFVSGIIDVSFAIEPTAAYADTVEAREQRSHSRSISRLTSPRSIAVIGASERPGTVGHELFANLLAGRFDGPVYPINPSAPHVLSVPTYPSVVDVSDDVHLAVVAVPAASVPEVLEQCAAKRVRGVIVVTADFSPSDGDTSEWEVVALARRNGMRLIGPGSMGMIVTSATGGTIHASFAAVTVRPGRVAISSRSGTLGVAMLEVAHRVGIGISSFVSLGLRGDVSANDMLRYWYDDPATDVVLLYAEDFGNPRRFGRIARRVSRRKPIVAVRASRDGGSSSEGGLDGAADGLYQQAGLVPVGTVTELMDVGRVLASQPLPAGSAVAVVTNARSPATLAVGGIVGAGLEAARLTPATCAALAARLPADVVVDNPLDLTHRSQPDDYGFALASVLGDDGVHAALAIYAPPIGDGVDAYARAIADAARTSGKPVLAVALGRDDGPLVPEEPTGVPAFTFPEPAVAALGRVVRYARWRTRPEGTEPDFADTDADAARTLVAHALAVRPTGTLLPLAAIQELLGAYRLPFAAAHAVTTQEAAVAAADDLGYPVALRASGLEHLARSESGGVALDLQSAEQVAGAYARMRTALGAAMAEAVVQRMVPGGVEVMIALRIDVAVGPVVSVGLGGAYADAIADRPARSLPITELDARELVESSRASAALDVTGADRAALEEMVCRVAQLADDVPELSALRLNPVLVAPSGAWAVDAVARVAPVASPPLDELVRRLG